MTVVKILDLIVEVHANGHNSASCSNNKCNAYFALQHCELWSHNV